MKITAKKHVNKKKIVASNEFATDKNYLMSLADEIENILLEDYDIDVKAVYHPSGDIYLRDRVTGERGLITMSDLQDLTGDLETDAQRFAGEFYEGIV